MGLPTWRNTKLRTPTHEGSRAAEKKTGVSQQNLWTDRMVKPWLLISHRIKWSLIHFPPCMSLPSDRSFFVVPCWCFPLYGRMLFVILMNFSVGKKRSWGTFLKMSGSRECKVSNTVNSSGPAPQARGLPVYQFLTGTTHAKLKQGIENLGTGPEHCVGELVLFIWETLTDSTDSSGPHQPALFYLGNKPTKVWSDIQCVPLYIM